MTNDQWQAMKNFIRTYSRLRIDHMIATAMLFKYAVNRVPPPEDWLVELKQMRALPIHREASMEIEKLLEKVEQDRSDSELEWLLRNLPKASESIQ